MGASGLRSAMQQRKLELLDLVLHFFLVQIIDIHIYGTEPTLIVFVDRNGPDPLLALDVRFD